MRSRMLVCFFLGVLLGDACLGEGSPVVGVVTMSVGGHAGSAVLSAGSTIFQGEYLSTEMTGRFQLQTWAARLYVDGGSAVTVQGAADALSIELRRGTVVVSCAKASAIKVTALNAEIRPAGDAPTVAQVSIAGSKALHIFVRRGELKFSYGAESEVIAEGSSITVVLDPLGEQGPKGAGASWPGIGQGHHRRLLILLWVGGSAAAASWFAVHEALESPDRP